MKKLLPFIFLLPAILLEGCTNKWKEKLYAAPSLSEPVYQVADRVPAKEGDPQKGFDYLIYGDYMAYGFPYRTFEKNFIKRLGKKVHDPKGKALARRGKNAPLPYSYTAFQAENGAWVVNGNCFACHATHINGELVLGAGNSFGDFRQSFGMGIRVFNAGLGVKYPSKTPEGAAYQHVKPIYTQLASRTACPNIGMNPAARTAEVTGLMRNPYTLELDPTVRDSLPFSPVNIATDVPPLWNVRKKNALYYNALGRGDFTKLLMQITLASVDDTVHARKVQQDFVDVLAWLEQLEPPAYPFPIVDSLAASGKMVFEEHCAGCHGTYGEKETYPNKIIPLHKIKTDPAYARATLYSELVPWYNQSWYSTSPPRSHHQPSAGYVAPPLDGVWVTAPYLHNGSIPTLEDLLNSSQRPDFWKRSGKNDDYDTQKVGWHYTAKSGGGGKWTYDTTKPGSSNTGHYYGDKLSQDERAAVIEYLKTL
ncbi:MAG: hypothetical protein AAGI38_21170 [Bacteroidota bacterium]